MSDYRTNGAPSGASYCGVCTHASSQHRHGRCEGRGSGFDDDCDCTRTEAEIKASAALQPIRERGKVMKKRALSYGGRY